MLGEDLWQYYDLGTLFAGNLNGVLTWSIRHLGEWWFGPVIGPEFADAVLEGWTRYDPTEYVPPMV